MPGHQDQTLSRKFKELFITLKVGETVSKKKIMAGYLNISYYGRGASGIQAAARAYYNKDAKELDPSECAFLATLLKGASYYDPAGCSRGRPVRPPPRRTPSGPRSAGAGSSTRRSRTVG